MRKYRTFILFMLFLALIGCKQQDVEFSFDIEDYERPQYYTITYNETSWGVEGERILEVISEIHFNGDYYFNKSVQGIVYRRIEDEIYEINISESETTCTQLDEYNFDIHPYIGLFEDDLLYSDYVTSGKFPYRDTTFNNSNMVIVLNDYRYQSLDFDIHYEDDIYTYRVFVTDLPMFDIPDVSPECFEWLLQLSDKLPSKLSNGVNNPNQNFIFKDQLLFGHVIISY